jgi:hypothetical protein
VAAARTFLVYAPSREIGDPLELSVALPLTARAGESAADGAARAVQTVTATAGTPIDWIVDPRLIDPAGDGPAGDDGALAAAIDKNVATRSLFSLPWGDPDVSQLAHLGKSGAKTLFALARSLGQTALAAGLPSLADEVRRDLVWPLDPIDADLLELVHRTDDQPWIAALPASPSGEPSPAPSVGALTESPRQSSPAPRFRAKTAQNGPAPVVTPTDPGRLTSWPRTVQLAGSSATGYGVIPDPDLTAAIEGASRADTEAVAGQFAASLLALRAQAIEAGRALDGAVVILPRSSLADPGQVARRVARLFALPWLKATPLGDVLDNPGGPVARVDPGPEPGRGPGGTALKNLNEAAHHMAVFSKLTSDPDGLMAQWAPKLVAPVAGSLIPAGARQAAADEVSAQARSLARSVETVSGSEVTMISASTELPVTLHNSSPLTVTVTVGLSASKRALVTDKTVPVVLEPDARTTVRVPVRAIANGDVDVDVLLMNADGEEVSPPSTFRVRVHAEWENISTAVLGGAVALLLVFGLVRAIRRRRRGTAPEPAQ